MQFLATTTTTLIKRHHTPYKDNGNLSVTDINYSPNDDEYYAMRAGAETWEEANKWGHYETYVLFAMFGLAIACHGFNRFVMTRRESIKAGPVTTSPRWTKKLMAYYRAQAYYHPPSLYFRGSTLLRPPAIGKSVVFAVWFAVTVGICFGIKPLYRISPKWGAPPVANRAEWFAMALIPWVFAVAMKISPITLLTRISHDRLQVWHQWGARFLLLFSTIHGAPYIYQRATMWGAAGFVGWLKDDYNWTGVAAYVPLFWLVFSSFAPIRNFHYELWIIHHILSAILFIIFMFKHVHSLLDSDQYLWGTVGVMVVGYLLRLLVTFRMSGFFKWPRARAEMVSPGVIRMTIPTTVKWLPGSHVFLRFPTLNILQAHPFTISSVPAFGDQQSIELLIGVRNGMTKKLSKRIERSANGSNAAEFPVIVDGAFSGVDVNAINRHDKLVCFAGGAGISYILPLILSVIKTNRNVKSIRLIWAVPSADRIAWLSALHEAITFSSPLPLKLDIELYITRRCFDDTPVAPVLTSSSRSSTSQSDEDDHKHDMEKEAIVDTEKGCCGVSPQRVINFSGMENCTFSSIPGRPPVQDIIAQISSEAEVGLSAGIAVCGPGYMAHDVGNAVAGLQVGIIRKRTVMHEAVLYKESFSW